MANQNNQSNPSQIELDDVAEWVGLHYGRNFENESHDKRVEWTARYAEAHGLAKPEPQKFATGDWMHLFGPGMRETRCRIVIDLEQSKMVAAQEWTGLKFEDIRGDRLKDLAESVIEANEAHGYPHVCDLDLANEMPEWATQLEVPTVKPEVPTVKPEVPTVKPEVTTVNQDVQAIVARIESDLALLRQLSNEPTSIKLSEKIDFEVRPANDDDRVIVGCADRGYTVVNYTSEGLILDVIAEGEIEPTHTASFHASDLENVLADNI